MISNESLSENLTILADEGCDDVQLVTALTKPLLLLKPFVDGGANIDEDNPDRY